MTSIEWTDETWNPTRGCSMAPGSELGGCLNCYAARNQLRRPQQTATSGKPFSIMRDSGPRWSGEVELIESKLTEPLRWKTPRRVFVNSMSDLFHEDLPERDIVRIFEVMVAAERQTFQVLTKRPRRMLDFMTESNRSGRRVWPPRNIQLGVSVEDQPTADNRIPDLLRTPAAVRFVSYEPALAAVDFSPWLPILTIGGVEMETWLDWIIVGGESGPGARPCDIQWIRSIRDQCKAAGVPLFVKQLGANPVEDCDLLENWIDLDSKGGNWDEWPADLRIREFPR